MAAIELEGLTKKFDGFTAVDGIDLEIKEGELFALLGPNGAGKTTTISMLATLLKPTGGKAFVNGYDVVKDAEKVRHEAQHRNRVPGPEPRRPAHGKGKP